MNQRRILRIAFTLAFLSGISALTHELLWTRRLIDLLGASTESSSRVFGCFFLGLGLGAACAAGSIRRVARPWRMVAAAELGVAVCALPVLFLPSWTDWIWPALGLERLASWPGATLKTLLSAGVLLPPSFCMGLVLPFLSYALLRETRRLDTDGVRLYAVNTFGGAVGLLLAVLCLLPSLGAVYSMTAAVLLNVAVAMGAFWMDKKQPAADLFHGGKRGPKRMPGAPRPLPPVVLAIAFLSGAGILAAEVVANQLFMLVATLSFYAPAAILFAIIFSLASGAVLALRLRRRWPALPLAALVSGALAAAALALAAGPMIFMGIVQHVNALAANGSVNEFIVKLALLAFVSLGPGFLLMGLVFPLTMAWTTEEAGDLEGKKLGWLLAVNGFGGVAGAEIAYRVLLPVFDVHLAMAVVAGAYALAGFALSLRGPRRLSRLVPRSGALACVFLLAIFGLQRLPLVNTHHGLKLLDHRSGREGAVAVVESEALGRCILVDNQYLLGGSHAVANEERQANLPLLLHPAPRDVAFIGLATGITPGAALIHSNINSITVMELSSLVKRAADHFFAQFNHGITRSHAEIVVDDGRTVIAAAPNRFDVVIGDLFLPWAPGEARLYSVEHFEAVRRSLRPGGVFCQWLAMYQFTPAQFEIIANTFQKAFPHTHLFCNALESEDPTLALVGFQDDRELDWRMIAARCSAIQMRGVINDSLLRSPESIAQLYLGEWQTPRVEGGVVAFNTLGNLLIELDASRERLVGKPGAKYFYGSRWLRFCHDRRAGMMAQSPPMNSPLTVASLELADDRMREDYQALRNSQAGNRMPKIPRPSDTANTNPAAAALPR
jgi:spermidine synthase